LFWQAGLFQNRISRVAGLDVIVNDKPYLSYRAEPNLVVTLPVALKAAPAFMQLLFQFSGVIRH
jgi:hypothetical protein